MKKFFLIALIILLIIIIFLFYKRSSSVKIKFGYENTGATSADDDIHYQLLPQWDYKILDNGSVYYRETDGILTRNKNEYKRAMKEFDKSYIFIKKIDRDTLNTIIDYITEKKGNNQSRNGINYDYYYIYIKDGSQESGLRGEEHVKYLKNILQKWDKQHIVNNYNIF